MTAATPHAIKKLAKFLSYVLGRRPDEYGLVPDEQGYVKIKTLLQSLHEDSEWRHLRQSHLNSLMLMQQPAVIEIKDDLIRACHRDQLPEAVGSSELPKQLFTTVRRRAYPVVIERGIRPTGSRYILLSSETQMAERLGRRTDPAPVLLKVQVASSQAGGTTYLKYGERLYLADFIPAQTFSGPPPPKAKPSPAAPGTVAVEQPKTPGSFFPEPSPIENPSLPRRRKRNVEWRQDRRRARKEKERRWK
jgi:putative RNA 2'-phosphotransferase